MTLVLVVAMGILVVGIVTLPLIDGTHARALPETGDPEGQDLEEERAALLNAVREVSERHDLPDHRREQLRDRYLRKAAIVERWRTAHVSNSAPAARPKAPLQLSWVLLLILIVPSLALIASYVVPRVQQGGTVTTNRPEELAAGRDLQRLQRAVRDDPNVDTLAALGDAYWRLLEAPPRSDRFESDDQPAIFEEARETYKRLVEVASATGRTDGMAIAQRRLGLLDLMSGNVPDAETRLERAVDLDPMDGEALYTLGQVRYAMGRLLGAAEAWRAYLATPLGEGDEETAQLATRAERLAPLVEAVQREETEANYMALADALWVAGDRPRAASIYAERLQRFDGEPPRAVRRLGMALFFAGNAEQAVLALERARTLAPDEPETLLFLGNAYRALNETTRAIEAWRAYVVAVGGAANAGRVPDLIAEAQGGTVAEEGSRAASEAFGVVGANMGPALFEANCARCHGPTGAGGVGPALAGNPRVADRAMVENTVRYGRNLMPGFGALLSDAQVEEIVDHVASLASP